MLHIKEKKEILKFSINNVYITLFMFILALLLTGCSTTEEYESVGVEICGESFSNNDLSDEKIKKTCDDYYMELVIESILDVDYVGYCAEHEIKDETECLENYRDEIIDNISNNIDEG